MVRPRGAQGVEPLNEEYLGRRLIRRLAATGSRSSYRRRKRASSGWRGQTIVSLTRFSDSKVSILMQLALRRIKKEEEKHLLEKRKHLLQKSPPLNRHCRLLQPHHMMIQH